MAEMKNNLKGGVDTAADMAKTCADPAAEKGKETMDPSCGMVDSAKNAMHNMADKAQEWAGEAYDAAKHAGQRVQRWAGDAYEATADTMGDFGRELTGMVRRHPIPALLIGFGVGLMVGRVARIV